ncbi:NADP-dependent malic enzyme, chloroplastic-like [Olea europaea subsp. europaea]|uniref:NADP-dependent malic enzyme, chloroplastic-like n=1 Tax=Olea europaea subsp. europaea TaxID=158383 RepID=A0A8S0R363_OLEEU|nr:NADP-dependent malic enzyme, chloroplastic-like [Olea europaea subsp. europaea]
MFIVNGNTFLNKSLSGATQSLSTVYTKSGSSISGGGYCEFKWASWRLKRQRVDGEYFERSGENGYQLLRDPYYNKGLAFAEKKRDAYFLHGLLSPGLVSQEIQVKKMMHNMHQYQVPLQRNVFRQSQGLFISLKEKGRIFEVLKNWPEKKIQVIVVTDGKWILGLRYLGYQGMGIPVGKLSLYSALGGICPSACLPVTIDVGMNNETLLEDEFYIGLRRMRATGQEYSELLYEFMSAVKQNYGEKVLIQFEDAAIIMDLISFRREAGPGIVELIALEISKKTGAPLEETRKKIWLMDSKGLIVSSRMESLQHFKRPWATNMNLSTI